MTPLPDTSRAMSKEHKYTTDGKKVVVIGSLNSQEKIVQEIFVVDGSEIPAGEHFVVKSLLDAPGVTWKENRIKEIDACYEAAEKRNKEQSDRLYQKRKELEAHLTYAAKALRGISPASFDLLVMFLTGRVKWIVTKGWNPEISEWKHGMCDEWLRLVSLFGLDDGTLTFRLSRYRDGSDNKSGDEFIPFEKYDDARDKWIELNGSTVNDYTVKTAAAHNIELPPEAVAEWMSKKTDGCRKEIESLRARIVAQETEIAKIDGAATGIGAKPKAVRRTVAKRSGAKPGAR